MADLSPIEIARFWSRVRPASDFQCWEWEGRSNSKGYGRHEKGVAHRIAYELVVGPIPDGAILRHKCDNPSCCNPKHLVPGDHKQNAGDMVERRRHLYGQRNPRAKLDETQAKEILRNPDGLRVRDLARKFGVSPATISLIRSGDRWAHLAK